MKIAAARNRWLATITLLLVVAKSTLAERDPVQTTNGTVESSKAGAKWSRTRTRLPVLRNSKSSKEQFFVEACESLLKTDEISRALTRSEYKRNMLIAFAQSAVYGTIFQHRYETFNELKLAQGPQVNEQKCLEQLELMANRSESFAREGFKSRDSEMHHILDLWGRESWRHLKGHMFFEGAYEDCLGAELSVAGGGGGGGGGGGSHKMRYCVMKFKYADWNQIDLHDIVSLSMGICIPKSCGSASAGRKFQLISAMATRHLTPSERNQFRMSGLYCLPDEDSALRSIWRSPKSAVTLVCVGLWICFVLLATYKHDKLTSERAAAAAAAAGNKSPAGDAERALSAVFRMLSIRNNLRALLANKVGRNGNEATVGERRQVDGSLDLSCIDGIKVIAMCYIIVGHVLMCVPAIMRNGRDLADQGVFSVAFLAANLLPAFAVNSFFAITGLLTSYLVLKQDSLQPRRNQLIGSPSKWIAFVLLRYLRIMPMYALAVLYCKTLAKFTGSGPHWDYATSALSQRRTCEHEHWGWTLTFSSNFLSPLEHCIPGGWYLANDFQFALVTPLYMALLHWAPPAFGQSLLYASIALGYAWGYASIYNSDLDDFRPVANFSPSGFKTYVSHLSFNYTQPQYRIPAYLIGLMAGQKIHHLESQRRANLNDKSTPLAQPPQQPAGAQVEPTWSPGFRKYGALLIAWLILSIFTAPFFGLLFPFCKQTARVLASWANPALHLHFAAGITHFIMLAATGDANKRLVSLLSASYWKPLARVSLCCLLFNVELINFIIQRQTKQVDITNGSLMWLNSIAILTCYSVSVILSCLFEAPIRLLLNAALAQAIKRMSAKREVDQKANRFRMVGSIR